MNRTVITRDLNVPSEESANSDSKPRFVTIRKA
jgi:hypothetical protein